MAKLTYKKAKIIIELVAKFTNPNEPGLIEKGKVRWLKKGN